MHIFPQKITDCQPRNLVAITDPYLFTLPRQLAFQELNFSIVFIVDLIYIYFQQKISHTCFPYGPKL